MEKSKIRKRGASSPTGPINKRRSSRLGLRESQISVQVQDKDSTDQIMTSILKSLQENTKEELKMFESDSTEESLSGLAHLSYDEFLCQLVDKFVKLRRFPKLIAKLLCSCRENLVQSQRSVGEDRKQITDLLLPNSFLEISSSVMTALPGGQFIDLWKSLYHNLKEECLDKLTKDEDSSGRRDFTLLVSELFCQLLMNGKVVDYGIQANLLEKTNELLTSLGADCLTKFSNLVLQKNCDKDLLKAFLKLTYAWGEMIGHQIFYNNNRTKNMCLTFDTDPSPLNLAYLQNYLTEDAWLGVGNRVNNLNDASISILLERLVSQKLKFMHALEKRIGASQVDPTLEKSLDEASKYVSINQEFNGTAHFDSVLIDIDQVPKLLLNSDSLDPTKFPQEAHLQYAVILELFVQVMKRLTKIKCYKKLFTKITKEVLSPENRKLISIQDPESKNSFQSLLDCVNELLRNEQNVEDFDVEFSCEFIVQQIQCLCNMNLEDYPTHFRSLVSICSLLTLIPLGRSMDEGVKSSSALNMISSLFCQCARDCYGSEFHFHIHWTKFFQWFQQYSNSFSAQSRNDIVPTILQNIYISKASVEEFEPVFIKLCEDFNVSDNHQNVGLLTLEFLLKEMKSSAKDKRKGIGEKIQNHVLKLGQSIANCLISNSASRNRRATYFRHCWLLRRLEETITTTDEVIPTDNLHFKILKSIYGEHVKSAFALLSRLILKEGHSVNENCDTMYSLVFLHSICNSREVFEEVLPAHFASDLWNISMHLTQNDWDHLQNLVPSERINLLPMILWEKASVEEFGKILQSLDVKLDPSKVGTIAAILFDTLDAKIDAEKRTLRGTFLEDFLSSLLQINFQMSSTVERSETTILPLLRLQTKLLSRKAICSHLAMANCLTSVSDTPLLGIKCIRTYRKVFCALADLLTAFTLHRQDVLSFRTHIYLQCFQSLSNSLVARADQKNMLTDAEVIDLRYCAHAMERICQSTKIGKAGFARIAPYFVAFMMRLFESFTIYPAIKDPLMSGCYKLLNLCDKHAIAQINSNLTVGSRGIFGAVMELYNKFYRYKGKV